MKKERFKLTPAVYMFLINGNNEVFCIRRANTGWRDGEWSLPAGHLDGGEPASGAAVRELLEEVSVRVGREDMQFACMVHRTIPEEQGAERIDMFFVVRKWGGEPKNNEPHKCSEVGWFAIDNLPTPMVDIVEYAFELFVRGDYYGEFNW